MARRGELGSEPAGRAARRGQRVGRLAQVEPLGEGEERPQPRQQELAGHGVALGRGRGVGGRRRRAAGLAVPVDADGAAALGGPVAVHLAHDEHRRARAEGEVPGAGRAGAEPELEGAVSGYLDRPVVERAQAVGHLDGGVVALQHLEAQVGGRAAGAGHHVLRVVAQVRVEVQGVRVVQPHLRVRAGGLDEVREVALVGPGQPQRRLDAARQVVMPLGQVALGRDVRGARDDLLGLGQRLSERLRQQRSSRCPWCLRPAAAPAPSAAASAARP